MTPLTLRTAQPGEAAEVARLILSANPHLEERIQRFQAAGGRWHDATPVVGEAEGRLCGCAVIFRRQIWAGSNQAAFGGIGAVCTQPAARGRGYATRVVQYCEDLLAAEGIRLAVLFANIVEFYERLGWVRQPEDEVEFPWTPSERYSSESPYDLRPFGPNVSQPALAKIYEQTPECAGGALVRSEGVWREYRTWQREELDLFWIACVQEMPVAYVRGRRIAHGLFLQEATSLPEHALALLPLLNQQVKVASPAARVTFRSILSRRHPLACILDGMGAVWRVTSPQTSMLMSKELPSAGGHRRVATALTGEHFRTGLPWQPRSWWAADRF